MTETEKLIEAIASDRSTGGNVYSQGYNAAINKTISTTKKHLRAIVKEAEFQGFKAGRGYMLEEKTLQEAYNIWRKNQKTKEEL